MTQSLAQLKATLSALPVTELQALLTDVTTASGQGAVVIARDVNGSVVISGSDNIVGDNNKVVIHQGADADTLKEVFRELLAEALTSQEQPSLPEISGEALRVKVLDFLEAIQTQFKADRIFANTHVRIDNAYIPIQVALTPQAKALQKVIQNIANGEPSEQDVQFFVKACQAECFSLTTKSSEESEAFLTRLIQDFEQDGNIEQLVTAVQTVMVPATAKVQLQGRQVCVDWSVISQLHHQYALYQRLMLLGEPGMGKSTLLRVEAGLAATKELKRLQSSEEPTVVDDLILPIFLKFSDLICPSQELIDYIPQILERNYDRTASEILPWIQGKLKSGRCILLIDSLDEFPKDKGNYLELKEKLERFLDNYPCPLICTSRTIGSEGNFLPACQDLKILPFEPSRIEHYVHTWLEDTLAAALMRDFRNNPQVFSLAENPLLLSLICRLYRSDEITLLNSRAKIYGRAVKHMLSDWSQEKRKSRVNEELWAEIKLVLLEALAYEFSCQGDAFGLLKLCKILKQVITSNDFADDFEDISVQGLLTEFSNQDGILQNRGGEGYMFIHRTFQEYLTARYLVVADKGVELAKKHFWNYSWHETISLTAGLMSDPVPLLQAILDGKDDVFKTQLLLAGQCIAECGPNDHPLVKEVIDQIYCFWESLWYSPMSTEFVRSVIVGIGKSQPYLFEKLIHDLRHPTIKKPKPGVLDFSFGPASVCQLLRVLGRIGKSEAVPHIVEAKKYSWREAAAALETMGSPEALEALLPMFNGDPYVGRRRRRAWRALNIERLRSIILDKNGIDPDIRREGVWILGERKAPGALTTLTNILKDETEDSRVRGQAAIGLGRLGDPSACEVLASFVSAEEEIAENVVWALERLRHPNAIEALLTALKDPRETISRKAAQALGELGDARAVKPLIDVLTNEQHPAISQAIEALSKIGDSQAIPFLEKYVHNAQLQWNIVSALGNIGTPRSVATLKGILDQVGNQTGTYHVASSLVNIGTPEAFEVLLPFLEVDHPEELRGSVAAALYEVDDLTVNEVLAEYINDENKDVKKWAINALLKVDENKGVAALITGLHDQDIRTWAGESLGEQTSQYVVTQLINILQDHSYGLETRKWAALDLGAIGNPQAIEPLIEALSDLNNHWNIRFQASHALSNFNTPRVVQALEHILDREGDEIAIRVAYDLADMGRDKAIDTLVARISDFDNSKETNRRTAVESLATIHSVKAIGALTDLLEHPESAIVSCAVRALEERGTVETLTKLIESPTINILSPQYFYLARKLAIRFANSELPLIPIYPDIIEHKRS